MSLINDALKRAKQAQQQATPPSQPAQQDMELRPVEPRQYSRPGVGLAIPILLGIASLVLLVLLWQTARNSGSDDALEVKARTKVSTAPPTQPAPVVVATAAPSAHSNSSPASTQSSFAQSVSNAAPATEASASEAPTNPAPVVAVAPPKPVLPRLQAIVFSSIRPSVMINGKTVFVGDKVGEFRVRAIDQESVTLVGGGQTNILTLPE